MYRYPVGNDDFASLRRDKEMYVDKTHYINQIVNGSKFVFLSRPRRFGKSLLCSTLKAYFEGRSELFEGLYIAAEESKKEKPWVKYPVLYFNMSDIKNKTPEEMTGSLMFKCRNYIEEYGIAKEAKTPGDVLTDLIERAYKQTGEPVVLIFDEYDAPLLNYLHKPEQLERVRQLLQEFYAPIKSCSAYERFCFITGITKFSQLSIFSTINNLNNISMLPAFAGICGITHEELREGLRSDVERLAQALGCTTEETYETLRRNYDGYHFTRGETGVYNPYSLVKAFANKEIDNYWFDSGTPTFLIEHLMRFHTDLTKLEDMEATANEFDLPAQALTSAIPLLYQSGYVTIKHYDDGVYTLGIPNNEVRVGLNCGLMLTVIGIEGGNIQRSFSVKFKRHLMTGDAESAMKELKAYMGGLPYVEGFKQKLADVANVEGFYEWTFYLILSNLNIYCRTQVKCIGGRIDCVVETAGYIYVMELKINGSAASALKQIDDKGYAIPYSADGRKVVKIGIRFDAKTRSVKEWKIN